MKLDADHLEPFAFDFFDQIKALLSPDIWESVLLDCPKNEMLALVLLHRRSDVNMSQVAEYVGVPLNTATGIIDRMERKSLVRRIRSREDKRVVTIAMTDEGREQFRRMLDTFLGYGRTVIAALTPEEISVITTVAGKVTAALRQAERDRKGEAARKVRRIAIE